MKRVDCKYIGTCKEKEKEPNLIGCTSGIPAEKMGIRTNGDRIRAMGNKELAKFLAEQFCHGIGEKLIMQWLESGVKTE